MKGTVVVNRLNKNSHKSLIEDNDRDIRTTSMKVVLVSLLMTLKKKLLPLQRRILLGFLWLTLSRLLLKVFQIIVTIDEVMQQVGVVIKSALCEC